MWDMTFCVRIKTSLADMISTLAENPNYSTTLNKNVPLLSEDYELIEADVSDSLELVLTSFRLNRSLIRPIIQSQETYSKKNQTR